MKLKDMKLSQIRKLSECYWVQHPMQLYGTKETNNAKYNNAAIFQLNNENILYGMKHFMLYDEDHIFTTIDEAINYCKEYGWNYSITENYNYKGDIDNGKNN